MMLFYKDGQPGYISPGSAQLVTDGKDVNAFVLQKNYLHLTLAPSSFILDDRLYFTMIIPERVFY